MVCQGAGLLHQQVLSRHAGRECPPLLASIHRDLRHVKHALSTARLVLHTTRHSMLTGLQATQFAMDMGMQLDDLSTKASTELHAQWKADACQPNFRIHVCPNPKRHCGPYHLGKGGLVEESAATCEDATVARALLRQADGEGAATALRDSRASEASYPSATAHDTIALVAISADGSIAAGASTNGAIHKVPGRVGDGAVAGGGAYADSQVGACGATGDGDVHLRFMPCYQVSGRV